MSESSLAPKPVILAFVDYYVPGYKAGGPIRSVGRIASLLQGSADFRVFTRDRDLGDSSPYPDVASGEWNGNVFYARPEEVTTRAILRVIREVGPDVVYLNSYFSKMTRCVLLLRRFGLLPGVSVLLAPRGEFSPGALRLKRAKKQGFLGLARLAGLHRGLRWHASSERELADVKTATGAEPLGFIKPPDIDARVRIPNADRTKEAGHARFVFLSRISPKKNLLGAIQMLGEIRGTAELTVYGPYEDEAYMDECRRAASKLPRSTTCRFAGSIEPPEIAEALEQNHFFLFPTFGENFGHVIAEALAAGCPALLSDQTPWLELESRSAGWVVPLDRQDVWSTTIQACIDMDEAEFQKRSHAARQFVAGLCDVETSRMETLRMFEWARAIPFKEAAPQLQARP